LSDTIVLVESIVDVEKIKKIISKDVRILSFNFHTHIALTKENIQHNFAEDYLTSTDKLMIFDKTASFHNWYKDKEFVRELDLNGINILGILDTAEFHMLLIHHIRNFLILKRIIEKEKPKKIIHTQNLHDALVMISEKYEINLETLTDDAEYHLEWDRIELKFNIGNKPISFKISRSTYNKIKSVFENTLCKLFGLWSKPDIRTKSILFLEINPSSYPNLLRNLHNRGQNILFFNRRRPAIWNIQSLNLLRRNNCRLINTHEIEKKESNKINSLTNYYASKLDQIWSDDKPFVDIFSVDGLSIWPTIKQKLLGTYKNRLREYITLILTAKTILEQNNISCILCSNVFGETEKAILDNNNNSRPSVLLEHGYANYTASIERFDTLSMYDTFRDKIAVWGETQKQYLIQQKHVDPNRILVSGSPRHDSFFIDKNKKTQSRKTVLLTIHSINQVSGQADTELYIKFDNLLRKICYIVKTIENVNLVVKLHPNQDLHNQEIKKLVNEIDSSIPIYQFKSIKELLLSSDILINISPEGFDPSTVLLEGLILNKPTMNIVIDNKFYDFQYEKDKAILSVSADSDLEKHLNEIILNEDLQRTLIQNGQNHVKNYLANHGTASEYLAKYLSSL